MENIILIICTFPKKKDALKIAKFLIKNKLCACINIFPCDSLFYWENKLNKEKEYVAFMKTRESLFEKVKEEIEKMHPYTIPEIISFKISNVNEKYFKWVFEETKEVKI